MSSKKEKSLVGHHLKLPNTITNIIWFTVVLLLKHQSSHLSSSTAKTARLFLSAIPPSQRTSGLQLQNEVLVSGSNKKPTVKVTFKDKTELEADPSSMNFMELGNYFDRHSRKLALKESIESQWFLVTRYPSQNSCIYNNK